MSAKKDRSKWTFLSRADIWRDGSLSIDAIVLWHVLMCYRDHKTGKCHPSVWSLRKLARMCRQRMDAAMKELIKAGVVKKTTVLTRNEFHLVGKRCHYAVTHTKDWVIREPILPKPERPVSEQSEPDRSVNDHKHIASYDQRSSMDNDQTNTPRPSSGYRFPDGDLEKFALLADWGIEDGVAEKVFDKLAGMGWQPKNGDFRDEANARAFAVGLGEHIQACLTGEAPPI